MFEQCSSFFLLSFWQHVQPLGQQNVNESPFYFISLFYWFSWKHLFWCLLQILSFPNKCYCLWYLITALLLIIFCVTYFGSAAFCSVIFQPCKGSHNLYCRYSSCVLMYIGAVLSSCCCSLEQCLNIF